MSKQYAALLPKTLPQELLSFLSDYIYDLHGENFLLCTSQLSEGYFLELVILKNDKSKRPWTVSIPHHYILAVADMSEIDEQQIGFLT